MFTISTNTARIPTLATSGSAGHDLYADLGSPDHSVIIPEHSCRVVDTGVTVSLPAGHVGLVCSRSGMAANNQVVCLNAPGVIDCDYRDTMKVILFNFGQRAYTVAHGTRIAQLVVTQYVQLVEPATCARVGGLGSTGR